jgi:hypothetical protein
MKQNFLQLFEIIKNKFILEYEGKDGITAMADFFGHGHKGKVTAWSKGQWPNAQDCWLIHKKLGIPLQLILTGQSDGEPQRGTTQTADTAEVTVLRQRIEDMGKIVAAQEKTIAAQEETIRVYKERERFPTATGARTPTSAVLSQAPNSED